MLVSADMSQHPAIAITTTVMSGGGGPMTSANYQMSGTVGQSSPLMDQGMDPYSDNYGLLPGFLVHPASWTIRGTGNRRHYL